MRWHLACSLLLLLLLTTLSSALKCIRCKNCAAKYEESQSVRCDPDKDTCQWLRIKNGQMDRDCGKKADCGSSTLLHYQMVDCCDGNNCNGASSGGSSLWLLAAPSLLLVPALRRL
ncbi:lymphocyte antigen 6H-like [Amphibalanus amphitrite]|uniref:lymphocyte antigen 6H-like n=1 Tax=Amphibalanus amphitrite TaxID=1232801 RepID=UPI001C906EF1|nr:lymphocyte antigen 6H-like [Amphibalanus amphitrite]XP_043219569.1 lymphocyte antigen 6H-like [Amphibalanus amphitrite]